MFVVITLKVNDCENIFKDSFRIFPCSLEDLAQIFSVEGKIGSTLTKNIFLFKNRTGV